MSMPLLHIRTGQGAFTMPLTYQPLTIGSAPDNLVQLAGENVAAHHCLFVRMASGVHILDLGAPGGTMLNGQPVSLEVLREGDIVRVGPAQFRLASAGVVTEEPVSQPLPRADAASKAPPSQREAPVPDSGAPIRVVPDPETDRPRYVPPPRTLGEMALPRDIDAAVKEFLHRPSGLAIVCGPAGSGRTTTAYAMIRHLTGTNRRVVTFEQPPELQIDGAIQVFVHDTREYVTQINDVLPTNPQVLMLGEPPNAAAANAAFKAAIGKCLVVAVANAVDSIDAIRNFLGMGVAGRTLGACCSLVIAQRVVKRLCENCKAPIDIEGDAVKKMAPFIGRVKKIYAPDLCPDCNNTGYVGQLGVFEILKVTDEIRAMMLMRHPSAEDFLKVTDPKSFIPLELSAYARVAQGLTSLEEADKLVAGLKR